MRILSHPRPMGKGRPTQAGRRGVASYVKLGYGRLMLSGARRDALLAPRPGPTAGTLRRVTVRGIDRQSIFRNDPDREDFIARLNQLTCDATFPQERQKYRVPAWGRPGLRRNLHGTGKGGQSP